MCQITYDNVSWSIICVNMFNPYTHTNQEITIIMTTFLLTYLPSTQRRMTGPILLRFYYIYTVAGWGTVNKRQSLVCKKQGQNSRYGNGNFLREELGGGQRGERRKDWEYRVWNKKEKPMDKGMMKRKECVNQTEEWCKPKYSFIRPQVCGPLAGTVQRTL